MFAPKFDYQKAASVADAVQALSNNSEAKIIAGGQSLIPLLKLRLARPAIVVDIGGIRELRGITVNGGSVSIGSLTTHNEIAASPQVQQACGILAEAAEGVGDPAVRNRGTIGGNVSHADPSSDLPTVLIALDAQFNIQGQSSRTVAASDFFTGAFTTALAENEVLTGVEVPVLSGNQVAEYAKMAHPATSFAVVGAAVVVTLEPGHGHHHHCVSASVAVGGVVPSPVRASSVEAALAGQELTQESITAAADRVADDLGSDTIGDIYASADYRRAMAAVELKHALFHAVGLAHH
jgi:carbon-monoxide dehydrogenase medium subunit